jgi:hypothetical protein
MKRALSPPALASRALAAAAALVASIALIALATAPLAAQSPADSDGNPQLERQAVAILQGQDSVPLLDTGRVALVTRALRAIRERFPVVADVHPQANATTLVLYPPDSAPRLYAQRSGAIPPAGMDSLVWRDTIDSVGIGGIDSLNRELGADTIVLSSTGVAALELHFGRPVDVAAAAREYEDLPAVGRAERAARADDGSWITIVPKGRRLHFVFARGAGACTPACTAWDYYYITYDTLAHTASMESVAPHEAERTDPIAYWDVPGDYATNAFSKADALYDALHDHRWWWRQHAVNVLGMLLGSRIGPWRDEPPGGTSGYETLGSAVRDDHRRAIGALIDRLDDADADVARLALAYLRDLSGEDLPGGARGARAWREWLRRSSR